MRADNLQVLALFIEKADDLRASRFWQSFLESDRSVSLSFRVDQETDCMIETQFIGPDKEALEALLLTLRMFYQPGDSISLRSIRRRLELDSSFLSAPIREKMLGEIVSAEQQLELPVIDTTEIQTVPELVKAISGNDARDASLQSPTQRELFRTFLYGNYAHLDERLQPIYHNWRTSPRFAYFHFVFVVTVSELLCTIFNVANILREALLGSITDDGMLDV